MKRRDIEAYIDRWLTRDTKLCELRTIESAAKLRLDKIYNDRISGVLTKKEWNNEYKCLKFLLRRIDLILEASIDDAQEEQKYLILPEHEKCGIKRYRYLCRFVITPQNIRRIKGFEELDKYGWYNSMTNPKGLVRDHRLSVKFGYDNNLDPEIVGHIANCHLISASANFSKSSSCALKNSKP